MGVGRERGRGLLKGQERVGGGVARLKSRPRRCPSHIQVTRRPRPDRTLPQHGLRTRRFHGDDAGPVARGGGTLLRTRQALVYLKCRCIGLGDRQQLGWATRRMGCNVVGGSGAECRRHTNEPTKTNAETRHLTIVTQLAVLAERAARSGRGSETSRTPRRLSRDKPLEITGHYWGADKPINRRRIDTMRSTDRIHDRLARQTRPVHRYTSDLGPSRQLVDLALEVHHPVLFNRLGNCWVSLLARPDAVGQWHRLGLGDWLPRVGWVALLRGRRVGHVGVNGGMVRCQKRVGIFVAVECQCRSQIGQRESEVTKALAAILASSTHAFDMTANACALSRSTKWSMM